MKVTSSMTMASITDASPRERSGRSCEESELGCNKVLDFTKLGEEYFEAEELSESQTRTKFGRQKTKTSPTQSMALNLCIKRATVGQLISRNSINSSQRATRMPSPPPS
jgi:hypothetical protein